MYFAFYSRTLMNKLQELFSPVAKKTSIFPHLLKYRLYLCPCFGSRLHLRQKSWRVPGQHQNAALPVIVHHGICFDAGCVRIGRVIDIQPFLQHADELPAPVSLTQSFAGSAQTGWQSMILQQAREAAERTIICISPLRSRKPHDIMNMRYCKML